MQGLVNRLRQLATDAVYLLQIFDAGARNALQTAELAQQLTTLARSESGDGFEYGFPACLGAAMAMTGNGKTMGLVADSLDEMQGG
jgi:hypothetical protein